MTTVRFPTFATIVVLLWPQVSSCKFGEGPIDPARGAALRETFIAGAVISGTILRYMEEHGEFPDISELEKLVKSLTVDGGLLPERLSGWEEGQSLALLRDRLDDHGGWSYNPKDGTLRVNSSKPFYLDSSRRTWIIPSDVNFTDSLEVPIFGSRASEHIHLSHELGQLATNNRLSVLSRKLNDNAKQEE